MIKNIFDGSRGEGFVIIFAVIALALFIYLGYVLIRPEKF